MRFELVDGSEEDRIDTVRELFREYADWLGVDLCFQGFEQELADLPGKYAPPRGRVTLALADGQVAGVVALRPHEAGCCEMKRLWVRPDYRGLGLGRLLVQKVIDDAREIGYSEMVLDTLKRMNAAVVLYRAFGFEECKAYTDNPESDVIFMRKLL